MADPLPPGDAAAPAPETEREAVLVSPSGDVMRQPVDAVQSLVDVGWSPATPEQAKALLREEEFTTTGQKAATTAEGALDALSFGGYSHAAPALGITTPERMAAREEFNPGYRGVGTAIGILAPVAATAGAALAPTAAKAAASTAPGLISAGGRAVTRVAEKAAAKALGSAAQTTMGKAAVKAAGGVAGGAVEGVAYEAGNLIHEKAINPNLTAEQVFGHLRMGAILGGGIGGAVGVGEVALPALVGKARSAISGAFKKTEKGVASAYRAAEGVTGTRPDVATLMLEHRLEIDQLGKTIPGVVDDISRATPEMADWIVKNSSKLEQLERAFPGSTKQLARTSPETAELLATNWDKIITDPAKRIAIAKNLSTGMDDVIKRTDDVLKRVNKDIAPAEAAALLRGVAPDAPAAAYTKMLDEVEAGISAMRAEPELYSSGYVRQLEKIRDGLVRDAAVSADSGMDALGYFNRTRTLRQQLDDVIPRGKESLAMGLTERNAVRVMNDIRGAAKRTLTDESVFGAAAARRAGLDDAVSTWLSATKDKSSPFRKQFMETYSDARGRTRVRLKQTKLNTWLNQMADGRGQEMSETWGRVFEAARKVADEADASFKTAPVGNFDRKGFADLLENAMSQTDEAMSAAAVTQIKNQLAPRMSWGSNPISSAEDALAQSMAEKAANMFLPGAITSTVRSVAKAATSVPRGMAVLSALEKMGKAVSKRIDAGVSAVLSGSKTGRAAAIGASRAASTSERIAQIQELAHTEAGPETLAKQTEGLEDAPDTSAAIQMTSGRATAFLASKLPQMPPPTPLGGKTEVPEQQAWEFNRYYDAVDNPMSALDLAASGRLLPQDVEAIKTVYPELYSQMAGKMVEKVAEMEGERLPYSQRLMMAMFLGQDMDGTLTPEAIKASQAVYMQPSQKSPMDQTGSQAVRPSQTGLGKLKTANRAQTSIQAADERMAAGG